MRYVLIAIFVGCAAPGIPVAGAVATGATAGTVGTVAAAAPSVGMMLAIETVGLTAIGAGITTYALQEIDDVDVTTLPGFESVDINHVCFPRSECLLSILYQLPPRYADQDSD